MRGPDLEDAMTNSSPPIAENGDGTERFSVLKQLLFQSFILQDSITQTWKVIKEKLQKHMKGSESRTIERDLQRSNYLVYERGGERGALITVEEPKRIMKICSSKHFSLETRIYPCPGVTSGKATESHRKKETLTQ